MAQMVHLQLPVTEARSKLAELLRAVAYQQKRVLLTHHGKPMVALVTMQDLRILDAADARIYGEMARVPDQESHGVDEPFDNALKEAYKRSDPKLNPSSAKGADSLAAVEEMVQAVQSSK